MRLRGLFPRPGTEPRQGVRAKKIPLPERQLSAIADPAAPPAWVRDAVFYQIFVDRFANGDRSTDPPGTPRWGGKPRHFNFFGGDLAGVRQKLPYLQRLGITAILFNPLFKANSNHKYNTTDYFRIDPAFGTNEEFQRLIEECHRRGLRVILDGVFNHTGDRHPFFVDAVRRGPLSPYWSWYSFHGYPVVKRPRPNYATWWGYASLPKLRVADHPGVRDYLYAVTEYWTRRGIDGWRLDVPTEIDSPSFWSEWRRRVRSINPEAYLVGEIWEEGLDWVRGHPFDATMSYVFRQVVIDFFAQRRISVDELDARLSGLRSRLGSASSDACFNLLASHDVPRFRSECGGYLGRVKEAVFFQMVYPGAPVIYYGEELGMHGGKDPDNRRCFPWSKVRSNELWPFFKRMIQIRQGHPALRGGSMRTVMRHNDFRLFAFWREGQGEHLLVVMNSGEKARSLHLPVSGEFPEGGRAVDYVEGRTYPVINGSVVIERIPPRTGLILGR